MGEEKIFLDIGESQKLNRQGWKNSNSIASDLFFELSKPQDERQFGMEKISGMMYYNGIENVSEKDLLIFLDSISQKILKYDIKNSNFRLEKTKESNGALVLNNILNEVEGYFVKYGSKVITIFIRAIQNSQDENLKSLLVEKKVWVEKAGQISEVLYTGISFDRENLTKGLEQLKSFLKFLALENLKNPVAKPVIGSFLKFFLMKVEMHTSETYSERETIFKDIIAKIFSDDLVEEISLHQAKKEYEYGDFNFDGLGSEGKGLKMRIVIDGKPIDLILIGRIKTLKSIRDKILSKPSYNSFHDMKDFFGLTILIEDKNLDKMPKIIGYFEEKLFSNSDIKKISLINKIKNFSGQKIETLESQIKTQCKSDFSIVDEASEFSDYEDFKNEIEFQTGGIEFSLELKFMTQNMYKNSKDVSASDEKMKFGASFQRLEGVVPASKIKSKIQRKFDGKNISYMGREIFSGFPIEQVDRELQRFLYCIQIDGKIAYMSKSRYKILQSLEDKEKKEIFEKIKIIDWVSPLN